MRTQVSEPTTHAIALLKRLEENVLIYRSLGDFEESGKLARVSFDVFQSDLEEVMAEVEPILTALPERRGKREIANALYSYRDGLLWWSKIPQRRVVHVSALTFAEATPTRASQAYAATIPYTVVIHWRQAGKYLKRAEYLANSTH